MGIYSNYGNVEAVMSRAYDELKDIRAEYGSSLEAQIVPDTLLVSIKNYLGNLRSSLDYLIKNIGGKDFPVASSQTDLTNKTTNLTSSVINVIDGVQPYNGQSWLADFSILNNKNKHFTLTPQIRKENRTQSITHGDTTLTFGQDATVTIGEGAVVSLGGAVFAGGQTLGVGRPVIADRKLQVEETIWVDFLFDNTNIPSLTSDISALPFLEQSFNEVQSIIKSIEMA